MSSIKSYINNIYQTINNSNLEIKDIKNEDIDDKIEELKYKIELKIFVEFEKLFKNIFKEDLKNTKKVLQFLYSEKKYINKLMDFDSPNISIQNILTKTTIIHLIEHFEYIYTVEKLEKKKWILVEYNNHHEYLTFLNIFNTLIYPFRLLNNLFFNNYDSE